MMRLRNTGLQYRYLYVSAYGESAAAPLLPAVRLKPQVTKLLSIILNTGIEGTSVTDPDQEWMWIQKRKEEI
jgi:hypothetical protein